MSLKNKIYNIVKNRESLFLVGKTDSGKTFFVKKELIPFLKNKGIKVSYFSDCNKITKTSHADIAIIDEVEILQDKDFLKKNNPNEKPYYTKAYVRKVKDWFKKLKNIKIPSIYIITRNKRNEIKNFKDNVKFTDFDKRETNVITFLKRTKTK
jgi:hypothetical protein